MFKVEFVRTADVLYIYTCGGGHGKCPGGKKHEHVSYHKGSKSTLRGHKTRKYETKGQLEKYTPAWKKREVRDWRGKLLDIERRTYQYVKGAWKRIN